MLPSSAYYNIVEGLVNYFQRQIRRRVQELFPTTLPLPTLAISLTAIRPHGQTKHFNPLSPHPDKTSSWSNRGPTLLYSHYNCTANYTDFKAIYSHFNKGCPTKVKKPTQQR